MQFSCHTWAFNDLTLLETLGTIARLGFRYADLASGPHLNMARAARQSTRPAVISEIRADLEMFNLQLADLYLMLPRISVNDDEKRQADITLFKSLVPFAQSIGTPGITISPGLIHGQDDPEALHRTIASLREMFEAAEKAGIALSIEPHMDSMGQSPEKAHYLIDAVPGLQLTLDWAHLTCQGVSDESIIDLLPHARHVQIRQAAKAKLQVPFDDGTIDIQQVINTLREADYQGIVCVEYLQTKGWHGLVEVNSVIESTTMRDALRDARDKIMAVP